MGRARIVIFKSITQVMPDISSVNCFEGEMQLADDTCGSFPYPPVPQTNLTYLVLLPVSPSQSSLRYLPTGDSSHPEHIRPDVGHIDMATTEER